MRRFRDNSLAVALAAGLGLALVFGIVYAVAASSRQVSREAEALHVTHEAIQAATVARAQLALAAYQVSLAGEDVIVDPAAIDHALTEAITAIAAADRAGATLARLGDATPESAATVNEFVTTAGAVADDLAKQVPAATDTLNSRFAAAMDELGGVRDELTVAVGASDESNTWISAIAGFLAVFAIPAAVISAYFVLDQRRRRQHELEVALEAERAALTSRERFLTTVSHELRKPLTGVRGIAAMLAKDEQLMKQPRMTDLHALLVGELDDMTGLVDDLLAASRLEAGGLEYSIEPVDVRAETRALLDTLNHRGASVYIAMDEGVVEADRRRLRQIVRNLVSNAVKYGGPNIEVKGLDDGDSYTVVVVDDGQGVPRDVEEHLFTRFTHPVGDSAQSVGLGLSIVMALAVGMGGTAFHSREDGLTRFGVRLPKSAVSAKPAPYEPPTMAPTSRADS
ncbi:MAG: HAMP domain-containing histidine kinase [bacterium]|nr:HAMP domain-containing histidine kinase [bacterium]